MGLFIVESRWTFRVSWGSSDSFPFPHRLSLGRVEISKWEAFWQCGI